MKKVLALFIAVAMIFSMAACNNDKKGSGETLTVAISSSPTSLDEGYSTNAYCRQVSAHIFETLYTFDDGSAVIPQLADKTDISSDGLTYNMTLRKGIKFHDGSTFDADDVVASIERYKTTSTYSGSLNDVTVEKVSDYEVKFTCAKKLALLSLLAFPQRAIMIPSEIAKANMGTELKDETLIGTGPYKLKEWQRDVKIVLEKFDDYVVDTRYDKPMGLGGKRDCYFQTIEIQSVTEVESRIAGLETGEFSYIDGVPAVSYDRVNDNKDLVATVVKPGSSIVVELNHAEGFTADLNFRKALVAAVDPNKVMLAISSGRTEFIRLDPSLYQPEQYFYTEKGSQGVYNSQNLEKVKEYLKAANYNGEELIYLTNRDYPQHYAASIALIEQWQAAGINVVAEFHDWTSQIAKAQTLTGWSINQSSYSARFDPNQVRNMIHSSTLGAYGFKNADVDALLDKISEGGSNEERFATWEQLQEKIWEQIPFIKFGDLLNIDATRADIKGYTTFYFARFWMFSK